MSVYNSVLFHLPDPNEQCAIFCIVIYKSSVKNDGQVSSSIAIMGSPDGPFGVQEDVLVG